MQSYPRCPQGPAAAKGLLTYALRRPVGPDIVVSGCNVHPGDSLFHFVGNLISPAGERGKLSVLIYHRVLAAPDSILYGEIDAMRFEVCMELVAAEFNVLPLGEACSRLVRGALPARAVCITFDDGYSDNEQIALPILKRLGLPATFFVATGFSNGGIMFNDGVIEAVRHSAEGTYDLTALGFGNYTLRRQCQPAGCNRCDYRPAQVSPSVRAHCSGRTARHQIAFDSADESDDESRADQTPPR